MIISSDASSPAVSPSALPDSKWRFSNIPGSEQTALTGQIRTWMGSSICAEVVVRLGEQGALKRKQQPDQLLIELSKTVVRQQGYSAALDQILANTANTFSAASLNANAMFSASELKSWMESRFFRNLRKFCDTLKPGRCPDLSILAKAGEELASDDQRNLWKATVQAMPEVLKKNKASLSDQTLDNVIAVCAHINSHFFAKFGYIFASSFDLRSAAQPASVREIFERGFTVLTAANPVWFNDKQGNIWCACLYDRTDSSIQSFEALTVFRFVLAFPEDVFIDRARIYSEGVNIPEDQHLIGTERRNFYEQYLAKIQHNLGLNPDQDNTEYFHRQKSGCLGADEIGNLLQFGKGVTALLEAGRALSATQHIKDLLRKNQSIAQPEMSLIASASSLRTAALAPDPRALLHNWVVDLYLFSGWTEGIEVKGSSPETSANLILAHISNIALIGQQLGIHQIQDIKLEKSNLAAQTRSAVQLAERICQHTPENLRLAIKSIFQKEFNISPDSCFYLQIDKEGKLSSRTEQGILQTSDSTAQSAATQQTASASARKKAHKPKKQNEQIVDLGTDNGTISIWEESGISKCRLSSADTEIILDSPAGLKMMIELLNKRSALSFSAQTGSTSQSFPDLLTCTRDLGDGLLSGYRWKTANGKIHPTKVADGLRFLQLESRKLHFQEFSLGRGKFKLSGNIQSELQLMTSSGSDSIRIDMSLDNYPKLAEELSRLFRKEGVALSDLGPAGKSDQEKIIFELSERHERQSRALCYITEDSCSALLRALQHFSAAGFINLKGERG